MEKCQKHGDLIIVFINDEKITDLNQRYLNRANPTDVLAFNYSGDEDETVWGEIYISFERAVLQGKQYGVALEVELARLVIHGILHLLGYRDYSKQTKKKMTQKEDEYLLKLHNGGLMGSLV